MGIKRREKLRMACDGNGSRETSYRRGRSFEMNMIGKIHGIVWGPWTPVLFLMVGFVYSVRIRFFQIRKIPDWWNATIGNLLHDRSEHRGSFRSACTALACASCGARPLAAFCWTAPLAPAAGASSPRRSLRFCRPNVHETDKKFSHLPCTIGFQRGA